MSFAFWLSVSLWHSAPRHNRVGRRQPNRPSHRVRPFLESLEERSLLDSSGVLPGAAALASNFAPISIGLSLPIGTNFPATTGVTTLTFPTAAEGTALAATSAFLGQNQVNSQFRDFAVNSEGETDRLFQNVTNILLDAYGFGSGTQPNAPWAPAAYNLGLANHQFGYPSQSDMGFSPTPPWFRAAAQLLPQDQVLDADTEVDRISESLILQQSAKQHEPQEQPWTDEKSDDNSEKPIAPSQQSAEEEQKVPEEASPNGPRGDPTIEEALFTDPLLTLIATHQQNRFSDAAAQLPQEKHALTGEMNATDGDVSENSAIPTPLWISALAPAQMAALVVGLPGIVEPRKDVALGSTKKIGIKK